MTVYVLVVGYLQSLFTLCKFTLSICFQYGSTILKCVRCLFFKHLLLFHLQLTGFQISARVGEESCPVVQSGKRELSISQTFTQSSLFGPSPSSSIGSQSCCFLRLLITLGYKLGCFLVTTLTGMIWLSFLAKLVTRHPSIFQIPNCCLLSHSCT